MARILSLLLLLGSSTFQNLTAQTAKIDSNHLYKFWITSPVGSPRVKPGYLYLADTGCLSLTYMYKRELVNNNNHWCTPVHQIQTIQYRRDGKVIESALIGSLAGLTLGFFTGFAIGDDPPCQNSNPNNLITTLAYEACVATWTSAEAKAIMLSVPGTGIGAIVGGLLGMSKMIIPISGLSSNYQNFRPLLKTYEIRN